MPHEHDEYFKIEFLKSEISKKENFLKISEIFSLLADSTRLKIFWLLCHSKECVLNLSEIFEISMPAVSHHLKILKDAGLIEGDRDGKEVFYNVCRDEKCQMLHGMIEKLMAITCPDFKSEHEQINEDSAFMENQVETIKQVHDYLLKNLSKRITIEELSKKFAMNSTTLKTVFKDVYGTAIASHIKEHRMEKAAELLASSEQSINEIALAVGYESQSKFSAVFKEAYGVTPADYKKNNKKREMN